MSHKQCGGPAFPGPSYTERGHLNGHAMGMTLRDWFAGQALAAEISGRWANEIASVPDHPELAKNAYELADAMLAARDAAEAEAVRLRDVLAEIERNFADVPNGHRAAELARAALTQEPKT